MKSVIFSVLVLFGGCVFAQPGYKLFSSGANILSPRGSGGYVDQDGNTLILLSDGHPGSSPVQTDVCLIKLSSSGDMLWSQKYFIPDTYEELLSSVIESDDSYFVIGNSGYWPNQVDGLVLKVRKSDGVCTIAKTFGGPSADRFSSAIKKSATSFVVCGYSLNNSFVASSPPIARGDGIVIELDMNLDTLRTRRVGAYNKFDRFDHMALTSSGDILLMGVRAPNASTSPTDNEDVSLVKFSQTLNPLWAKLYHHPISGLEQPSAILEGLGGRIFMVTKLPVANKTGVLKLSPSGIVLRSRGISDIDGVGESFSSGRLMVFGQKSSQKAVLSCLDTAMLSPLWSRLYTFGSSSYAMIHSLQQIGSETFGFGFSHGITKVSMFKSDNTGSLLGCDDLVDDTFTMDSVVVDVSRTFTYLTGRFRYSGVSIPVVTQTINLGEFSCESVPLPIELISFRAEKIQNVGVNLLWSTASERNVSHFVIEKSEDALRFDSIGFVEAVGNSATLENYAWLDEDTKQGPRYYRLRSVDEDGTEETSSVVFVSFDLMESKFSVFPNPASRKVTIRGVTGEVLIRNTFGQIVGRQFAPDIDVGMLPRGVYTLLSLQTNDQVRLVVE